MSNKALKASKRKKQREKASQKKARISIPAIVLGFSTIVGVPAALVAFWPRMVVSISDPANPHDPFSAAITITNTGYLPLNAVWPALAVYNISTGALPKLQENEGNRRDFKSSRISYWTPRNMGLDDKFTVAFNDLISGIYDNLESADVMIRVRYEIPFIHLHREKRVYAFSRKQSDGRFYWYVDTSPHWRARN